jgi:hypothetical protein
MEEKSKSRYQFFNPDLDFSNNYDNEVDGEGVMDISVHGKQPYTNQVLYTAHKNNNHGASFRNTSIIINSQHEKEEEPRPLCCLLPWIKKS